MSTAHNDDDDQGDDRLTAQEEQEEEEAGEEEDRVGGGEVTSQQQPATAPPPPPPPRAPPKTSSTIPTIKPYHPRYRFLHPYYWLNPLALAALYASFRRQWLERAEASVALATSTTPDHPLPQIPYSRNLTKPSDLLGWERQVVFFFTVVFLYKTLLKRRSWDAAASQYIFYARTLVAVVLFSCDWRWLILHVLLCWFGYAAVAQPTLDLDGLASTRMKAYEKKQQEEEEEEARSEAVAVAGDKQQQQQKGATAPTNTRPSPPLGLSLPMHPPRLNEMVLGQGGGGEADDDTTTTTGSAKKAARQLQQQQKLIDKQAKAGWVDSNSSSTTNMSPAGADYWVLLVACLSGGHHAASAAYAPAHDDLAVKYGEMILKRQREQQEQEEQSVSSATHQRPARLRFAHLDAALFGAYCASSPVLGLPPPQQLTWSSAVPCALLIDGRRGKLLARMPTKAQVDAPFTPNMFTSYDVERAFDLEGIVAGRAPKLSPAAAAAGGEEEEDGFSGGKGKKGGGGGGKSKDA